ncbi:unnamed protein product [Brassica napus]|uniref:(rape) hypothetical protein n=1 Tax=Brassica napus TaxID=3708 RepID=A0A816TEU5_BRANA|nr:unnamed protein product [Brassica napus]
MILFNWLINLTSLCSTEIKTQHLEIRFMSSKFSQSACLRSKAFL